MNEFLTVCEQDGKLVDYLKYFLNQKATLQRKTWSEVFTDATVEVARLTNSECYEYFDEYSIEFIENSKKVTSNISDEEYVSCIVKTSMLRLLNEIAYENGYFD